jgi:hypothetical protein
MRGAWIALVALLVTPFVSSPTPTAASGPAATAISLGAEHGCAVLSNGMVGCWGGNGAGQLGDGAAGTDAPSPIGPINIPNGQTVTKLAAGTYHTCAITTSGQLVCWGLNSVGQLGAPVGTFGAPTALTLPSSLTASAVAAGSSRSANSATGPAHRPPRFQPRPSPCPRRAPHRQSRPEPTTVVPSSPTAQWPAGVATPTDR